MSHDKPASITLHGTPVSSGITIGRVYLLERDKIHVAKRQVREEQIEKEIVDYAWEHGWVTPLRPTVHTAKSVTEAELLWVPDFFDLVPKSGAFGASRMPEKPLLTRT